MKNVLIVFALASVLVMAGSTSAEFIFEVTPLADPAPGLEAYLVTTTGASAFKGLTVTGVHQVSTYLFGTLTGTPTGVFSSGNPGGSLANAVDSHFIFNGLSPIVAAGSISETNTQTGSPITIPPDFGGGLQYYTGIGTLGNPNAEFGFIGNDYDPSEPLELMQVVIPAGTFCDFSIHFVAGNAGRSWEYDFYGPEPSTIMMLFAGSLCLLGVRIRK